MRAKGCVGLLMVGMASVWAQTAATGDAPRQGGIAGTWRVESTAPSVPWTAVFRADGPRLIGAVSACTSGGPSEIEQGDINGTAISFTCKSVERIGVGNRIVSLTGRINGDEIVFSWERRLRGGGYPGDDEGAGPTDFPFRASDPPRFIAKRVPDAADALTTMADRVRRAPAVSFDRIVRADQEPQNWLTYSGTLRGWRHSPLALVTPANVKDLELAWNWQTQSHPLSFVPTPLVVDGVMYTIQVPNDVVALDAATGSVLWTHSYTPAGAALASTRGGRPNRGLAILGHTLFLGTLDAHLLAIDAYSGKLLWSTQVADALDPACKGLVCYVITLAPLVVKDKVIVGVGGGDGSIRGFIAAFDATTGKEVWRFHTIPGPGEPGNETWSGDSWKTGGTGVWNTGSYDPDLNLTYWGTGNPAPLFDATVRIGDNLYSNSVVALDADTGKLRWHYQFTPNDDRDWDAAQVPILVDLTWQGQARKVLLSANKNGLMYVLDRTTGQFLMGKPFVDVNWMRGFDAMGRPIRVSAPPTSVRPAFLAGATNWYPPSYSSATGLLYVPATGQGFGAIRALEPRTGDQKWEFRLNGATFTSGVLTTASDLLFTGTTGGPLVDRYFHALDARTGQMLWRTAVAGSVRGSPITYSVGGRQYVAVAAGNTVSAFALRQ